jgi:predicted Zn-dependent protease
MDDLSARGVEHFNAGRFDEALRCFRAASGPEARVFAAHVLDAAGRPAESAAEFASVLEESPRRLTAYAGLANLLLRRGPLPGGEALRGALALKDAPTLRLCARVWQAAGDLEGAEEALRKARSPKLLAKVMLLRAEASLAAADHDGAEKELRKILALEPGHAAARKALVVLLRRRGSDAVHAGRLDLAGAALRAALRLSPKDPRTRRRLAEAALMQKKDEQARVLSARLEKAERVRSLLERLKTSATRPNEAGALLREALAIEPGCARAYLLAGGIFYVAGRTARGRALLEKALRGELARGERFTALMKLGRYKAALSLAEKILDGKPALDDLRAFWDPWEWDGRPRAGRKRELAALERAAGSRGPWVHYYREDLAKAPGRRYAWMLAKAGLASLCAGRFHEAEARLRAALAPRVPADWRTRAFLAEAALCRRRPDEAFAHMDRALREAPAEEKGQVVAWRGAFDLWLGRYAEAVGRFDEALRLGAPYAAAWRAAALLKLGRAGEALRELDAALARQPRDLEARVWRAEAKRALGLNREALEDLAAPALAGWLWARVNRALAKGALGDEAGLAAEFDALPPAVVEHIRLKTGATGSAELLEAGLALAHGFRREEYKQAIWMI